MLKTSRAGYKRNARSSALMLKCLLIVTNTSHDGLVRLYNPLALLNIQSQQRDWYKQYLYTTLHWRTISPVCVTDTDEFCVLPQAYWCSGLLPPSANAFFLTQLSNALALSPVPLPPLYTKSLRHLYCACPVYSSSVSRLNQRSLRILISVAPVCRKHGVTDPLAGIASLY
ncbi:MAG: hypothetical protein ACI9PC_000029 [Porticoccaceae bacterium]|jgi:hypothetical protein